ncbi:MAG TPA: hypothetical protein VD846_02530 [Allosphingosinicella sp.]|nr:hypothetical protein [Allosphingosinicella sp.]
MRPLFAVAILAIYAATFTALRLADVLGASAIFDWFLVAAAAALSTYLCRPPTIPKAIVIFTATSVAASLLALLISYTILGDSF